MKIAEPISAVSLKPVLVLEHYITKLEEKEKQEREKELKEDVEYFLNSKSKIYIMETSMRHICDTKAEEG